MTHPRHILCVLLLSFACGDDSDALDAGNPSDVPQQSADARSDVGSDASDAADATSDAPPACEPFALAAPPPASLGPCLETLPSVPQDETEASVDGVRVRQSVFMAMRETRALHADLYLPERDETTGALIVVHGGGWLDCENRRDDVAYFAQGVAANLGIPTVNVDYRLAQEGGGYPNNVMDVKCAVQWVRSQAAALNIDPERIGVMGTSAGAHLALMVGLTSDRDDLDPACADFPTDVQLALAYSGPSDLPRFVESTSEAREAPLYYTAEDCASPVSCQSGRACSRCVDASPLAHACRPTSTNFLLMQAPDPYDPLVAQVQAEVLATALESAGTTVSLRIPTEEAMQAAGCAPGAVSHGADLCMIRASQDLVNPAILEALGP